MDHNIQIFENEQFGKLRGVLIDGTPWFVGKDVCASLGDTNHTEPSISTVLIFPNCSFSKICIL